MFDDSFLHLGCETLPIKRLSKRIPIYNRIGELSQRSKHGVLLLGMHIIQIVRISSKWKNRLPPLLDRIIMLSLRNRMHIHRMITSPVAYLFMRFPKISKLIRTWHIYKIIIMFFTQFVVDKRMCPLEHCFLNELSFSL